MINCLRCGRKVRMQDVHFETVRLLLEALKLELPQRQDELESIKIFLEEIETEEQDKEGGLND